MHVTVLIVNWNGGPLLRRCLESLEQQRRQPDHVIVVDNASRDESLSIARDCLRRVELIQLDGNVGFAKANNIAARAARGADALALLNPDAFAEPGWLEALVDAAHRRPEVASFASQIRFAASPGRLDGAGDSYHVSGRAWRNSHGAAVDSGFGGDRDVFAACAAAAFYRYGAFHEAGGFDENYFCYFEDVDLGFRLRLLGHRCVYVHAAVVAHVSSAATGYRSDFAVYHGERNAVWTFMKDMPGPLLWFYLPQHLALNLAALLRYPGRGQGRVVWKAKLDALRGLGPVLKRRRLIQQSRRADVWSLRSAMSTGLTRPYVSRYAPPAMTSDM